MKHVSAICTLNAKRRTTNAITVVMLLAFSFWLLATVTPVPPAFAATGADCVPPTVETAPAVINQINDCATESNVYDDKMFNFNQISGTVDSIYTLLLGYSPLHPETDPITSGGGATTVVNGLVAGLYSRPPISGTYYVAQLIQKINPAQPAYAATYPGGIGYSILEPVKDIWSKFRDASYIGFVIIFVVIGFMIMFRKKISSQAVATIQDSLPRIVIALILVTFSYAIVGLIIDAMFVILNLIAALLISTGKLTDAGAKNVFENNIFSIVFGSMMGIFGAISDAVANILNDLLGKGSLHGIVGAIGGSLVGIIAAIAVLLVSIKIFLMLLMAYVSLILLTLFAPFILLFEALPGNNSFKEWFKQIIANLSVFPTVAVMIMLAGMLSGIGELGGSSGPLLNQQSIGVFPLLSGVFKADSIGKLIGLGMLLMTPSAAKMVKERLGIKEGAMGAGGAMAMAGLGAGAVASRNIGRAGGNVAMEHTGLGQSIGGRIAAFREEPKLRRQADVSDRLKNKFEMPAAVKHIPK